MSLDKRSGDEALQRDSPASRQCRGNGVHIASNIRGEDSFPSPIIKVLEKFVDLCKAERAAFRERVLMNREKAFSDDLSSLNEKFVHALGHVLDSDCIGRICQLMCASNKDCCAPCKSKCNDAVIDVLKIASEPFIAKYHNDANIAKPQLSDTVVVTPNDEESEACGGSIRGNSSKGVVPVVCLETPVVNQPTSKSPYASKTIPEPIHPFNKRGYFAHRDKLGLFPRTNLFSPEGLFDLHISDSDCDEDKHTVPDHCPVRLVDSPHAVVSVLPPSQAVNIDVLATTSSSKSQPLIKSVLRTGTPIQEVKSDGVLKNALDDNQIPLLVDGLCSTVTTPLNPTICDVKTMTSNVISPILGNSNYNCRKRLRESVPGGTTTDSYIDTIDTVGFVHCAPSLLDNKAHCARQIAAAFQGQNHVLHQLLSTPKLIAIN